ncbi:MAG: RagB/SusD family nutrient uptake outer membrane protein, partial [Paludibacter sp.]
MIKFNYILLLLLFVFATSSCEDYLTVVPENNQSTDEFWKTKEDVEAVLGAGYYRLRNAQEELMLWGEARGNGVLFTSSSTTNSAAGLKLRQFDILASNT